MINQEAGADISTSSELTYIRCIQLLKNHIAPSYNHTIGNI